MTHLDHLTSLVNRVLGTAYTADEVQQLPDELVEACVVVGRYKQALGPGGNARMLYLGKNDE